MVGWQEVALLAGIALLLFGPQKIPELAQALGKAQAHYKQGLAEVKSSFTEGAQSANSQLSRSPEEQSIINAAKAKGIPTEHRSIEAISEDLLNAE